MKNLDMDFANSLLCQGRIPEAIATYERIIDGLFHNQESLESLEQFPVLGVGNIEDQKGYYQFDIPHWFQLQLSQSTIGESPFEGLALCYSSRGRIFQGRCWYQQKLKSHPHLYQLQLGLAHSYYNSSLVSESFEAYNRAVSLDPKCDKGYQGLANICFYKLNQNARGREYALKALGCDSTNIYALIIVAFTEETFQQKELELDAISERVPQIRGKVFHLLGVLHFQRGEIDRSVDFFSRSLQAGEYISPILGLANAALQRQDNLSAQRYASRALQLEASNLEAIVALGAALTELGQYDEAVEWLYAATEIDETHFLPKYYLGILYHRQQSYGEALEWFELALKNIQREEVLLAVAICHSSMGQYGQAIKYLSEYSSRCPGDKLAKYYLGCFYFRRKQYEEALPLMSQVIDGLCNEPVVYFMAGCCCLNMNRGEEAQQLISKSVEVDPGFLEGWLAQGYCCLEKQDISSAISHFQTVLKIDPSHQEAEELLSSLQGKSQKGSPEEPATGIEGEGLEE